MSDLCPHESITIDQEHNRFTCVWCKEPVVMRTKAGQIITPAQIDKWVLEAELFYQLSKTPPIKIEDDDGCPNDEP
jgi:hypothetical protein